MSTNPYQLLEQIAQAAESSKLNLPDTRTGEGEWRGIGFRLGGNTFIAPMSEVDEILYVPEVTKVPGVKGWIHGIANIRGRLLSVVDLEHYFGGKHLLSNNRSRILATREADLYTGFIVAEVLGMQTFTADEFNSQVEVEKSFQPFVKGAYERDGQIWTIFSLAGLTQSPQFMQVAV